MQQPSGTTTLTELLVIDDNREGPLFGIVGDQAIGSNGQIYVSDYQSMQVHEFSAEGDFVRSIGGPGDGPGQFQIPVALRTHGDSLYVQDNRINRLSVFEQSTGKFVRSQNLKIDELNPYQILGVTDDAAILLYSRPMGPSLEVDGIVDHLVRRVPLTSSPVDSATDIWRTPGTDWKPIEFNGQRMLRNMPLSPSSACTITEAAGYCGYSSAVTIHKFSLTGDSLSTVVVDAEARPVSDSEREAILARIPNPEMQKQIIIPDKHPVFAGKLVVDSKERIWIHRGVNEDGQTEYWIIDPTRSTTTAVLFEGTVSINTIGRDKAVARVTSADGQQSVRVYALPS